jgi:hypothetical protein
VECHDQEGARRLKDWFNGRYVALILQWSQSSTFSDDIGNSKENR